jgi:pseudouridine kinase
MAPLISAEERDALFDSLEIPDDRILFTGGCNQDIQSRPDGTVVMGDSLPGSIELSPGGVARNIAENAARLGMNAALYAPVGDDAAGRAVLQMTEESGVDSSRCPVFRGRHTCSYAAFLDRKGEMVYAVNDMKLMDDFLPSVMDWSLLKDSGNLVVDANLPEETLEEIGKTGPILLADPVSAHKIHRLEACLKATVCIKPNRMEAESFCGFSIDGEADSFRACEFFLKCGCHRVFLSAGSDGFFCMDGFGRELRMPAPRIRVRSVTGAGDAASAALVLASLARLDLKQSAYLATLAACSALLSSGAINPGLSLSYLNSISKELDL